MLKTFRERTKTILWIVVLAFVISIFALWGMDLQTPERRHSDVNLAGVVDGKDISYEAYQNSLNQLWTQMREQRGETYVPSDIERDMLTSQAWELVIQGRLLEDEIRKLDITVSDDELVSFLRKNPHPQLLKTFATEDGGFDYQAYLKALANPEVDWTDLERWGRSVIPELKFQVYLFSQVHVPEADLLDRFKERNATMRAQYVSLPFGTDSGEPTEEELRALYESKRADFTDSPMRRIRVIEIEKKPSAADEEDALERIADLRRDILGGKTDFATAAADDSDDETTAANGGDLGFFKHGEKDAAIDSVAFSLRPGDVSEPFRSPRGYNLIKVEERKTVKGSVEVRARHILIEVEPGSDTIDSLSTYIRQITDAIRSDGFERAASDLDLPIQDFEPFPQGMFVKNLGLVPRIVNFAFGHETGAVSYPIETAASVYFVKVAEEIPERARPFEEVRGRLFEEARTARIEADAKTLAVTVRADMIANGFEAGAKAHGLSVQTTPQFKQDDQIPGIGGNTAFSAACRLLETGAVSPPVRGQDRWYLIKVIERSETDLAAYGEARAGLLEEMRNDEASRFMALWYQSIRDKAKVEDLRERQLR